MASLHSPENSAHQQMFLAAPLLTKKYSFGSNRTIVIKRKASALRSALNVSSLPLRGPENLRRRFRIDLTTSRSSKCAHFVTGSWRCFMDEIKPSLLPTFAGAVAVKFPRFRRPHFPLWYATLSKYQILYEVLLQQPFLIK
jgi:hypothetical protein